MSAHKLILVAALLAVPGTARATNGLEDLREDAQAVVVSGMSLLRRVLHLPQGEAVVSHAIAVSGREATLEFETAEGRTHAFALRSGRVLVDGAEVGRYAPGGPLDRAWRRLLADAAQLDTPALMVALRAWRVAGLDGGEAAAKVRLEDAVRALRAVAPRGAARAESVPVAPALVPGAAAVRLADLERLEELGSKLETLEDVGPEAAEAVRGSQVHLGSVNIPAGGRHEGDLVVYRGDADVFGEVTGSVVALYGDVLYHRGGTIRRNAISVGGQVLDRGGIVQGDIKAIGSGDLETALASATAVEAAAAEAAAPSAWDRVFHDVRNVVAVFVALAMLGFGTVFFGRRYLEVVADTATHSFGRSLVVGLLGQLLLLPTFAMLVVGLVFTIVGILLLPFAVAAYVVAALVAAVGGYLAVAHAVGETVTRRRMAHGAFVRAPNAYGYLFTGLLGLLGLWAAAALTGWMGPIVILFKVAAIIVTWVAATVGFGAVLLARGGLRETFAGRHIGEMSDEYLWATPPATPTAARMRMDRK